MNDKYELAMEIMRTAAGALAILFFANLAVSCMSVQDYSEKSWPEAFDELDEDMKIRYPFYDWKSMDASGYHEEIERKVGEAWEQEDRDSYYRLIREYAHSFHDSHIEVQARGFESVEKDRAGSYGLGILKTDQGEYIVHFLAEHRSAARGGIELGDEILRWNGEEIPTALSKIPDWYTDFPRGTAESLELGKLENLVRAPAGSVVSVEFLDRDRGTVNWILLTASDDGGEDREKGRVACEYPGKVFANPVKSRMISDHIGYIQITRFMPSLFCFSPYGDFRRSLFALMIAGAEDLIIDLRGNQGGLDTLIPKIAGHFVEEGQFYEDVSYYDEETGDFTVNTKESLSVKPKWIRFKGNVVILVDTGTLSTAEGLPLVLQNAGRAVVMGQYGTGAAFGCGMARVYKLPEDIVLGYLPGRSLDEDGRIQIDSDSSLRGGVRPDILVPVNRENAYRRWAEGEDVVLEAALDYIRAIPPR